MQSFGKSGILVRTNTSTDSDLLQSETVETAILKPHLAKPTDPGAFGRPLSPRSRFLLGCLSTGVAPRPSLLIRKEVTATLNLEHQCMGDQGGLLLAESLKDLPYLAELNIRDNKLTDMGLTAIIHSLHDCPHLTSLDVSENKIDDQAAAAISSYLTSSDCKLMNLVLRKSDVDDNEIGRFIQAILLCGTLRVIDLSSNLLGSNQNRKPLHPELTSGGQVLGDLLQDLRCNIQSLKLAWNMIRFDSAVALMSSLRSAHSLTDLDLSYNGIGQDGAEVLGNSLHHNSTLRRILLSNNNITPRGCFCIFTGIRTNQTLEYIDLSNNPIGERGLHAAMLLITEFGDRITITLRGCSVRTKDSTCWYNTVRADDLEEYPERKDPPAVILNLATPYDRAVAIDLLRVSARSRGRLKLESLKLLSSHPKTDPKAIANGQSLTFETFPDPGSAEYLQAILPSVDLIDSLSALTSSPRAKQKLFIDIDKYYLEITKPYERNKKLSVLLTSKLFQKLNLCCDKDEGEGEREREGEFGRVLKSSGGRDREEDEGGGLSSDSDWIVYHIFSAYDTTHEGLVSLDEIKDYLVHFIPDYLSERQQQISAYNEMVSFHPSDSTAIRYLPPEQGYFYCIPTISYDLTRESQATGRTLLSKFQMDNIILSLTNTDNVFHGCETSLLNTALNFSEAWSIYNILLKDVGDKRMIVKKILPHLANPYEAKLFLYQTLEDDFESRVNLRLTLGPLYRICLGQFTGHYVLNFSHLTERSCFESLWDLNKNSTKHRKAQALGDTSQAGDGSCFRNITLNSQPLPSLPADFMTSLSSSSPTVIEFDFVHHDLANTYGFTPLSEHRYHEILKKLELFPEAHPPMEEEEVITAMGFDALLRQSFNFEDVQRDEDHFTIPGEADVPNQIISSHLEGDRILDFMKWCEDSLPRRERIPFPKKFAPPPKSAKPPPSESKGAFSRGGTWKCEFRPSLSLPRSFLTLFSVRDVLSFI
jgi:hypothetical protein